MDTFTQRYTQQERMEFFLQALFILFVICAVIQLYYSWFIFSGLAFLKPGFQEKKPEPVPVSVVIAAKNEYTNLKNNLPYILSQDYPEFEVVVVNDSSDDDTLVLLDDFRTGHKNLKVINISENLNFFKGKKFPLTVGIKSARFEHLLLTDADCKPRSNQWIKKMTSNYVAGTEVVIGYGPYERKRGMLDKLVRYEALHVAVQYLSFTIKGMPYMGVGRNLSYIRSLFYRNKGFSSHYTIASGDDDLFINKVADKKNTVAEIHPDSHTVSSQPASFSSLFRQKKRHLSTSFYYKSKFKWLLGIYNFTQFFFWITFFLIIILDHNILYLLSIWAVRMFSHYYILGRSMKKLKEENLLVYSPLMEVIFVVINPILAFSNLIYKHDKWK